MYHWGKCFNTTICHKFWESCVQKQILNTGLSRNIHFLDIYIFFDQEKVWQENEKLTIVLDQIKEIKYLKIVNQV